jgi:hypothetical protein
VWYALATRARDAAATRATRVGPRQLVEIVR